MSFYPGTADVDGTVITVDQALNDPTIIEERVAEIAGKDLLVESIFLEGGEVTGGSVIYSPITKKHLYMEDDVAARQPGDEYPVVYSERPESKIARVEDFGGKFSTTDQARKRNQTVDFDNEVTLLANTITRKINARAVETLEAGAAVSEESFTMSATSPWDSIHIDGPADTISMPGERPTALFAHAQAMADELELGITYQRLILNPLEKAALSILYGKDLRNVLDAFNLQLLVSNSVAPGEGYLVDPHKAGFVRYEETLTVTTWRDEAHRQTWTQGYAMPVMGITTPSAVFKLVGLAS